MIAWNVLVTVLPGGEPEVVDELRHRGEFARTGFKGILAGRVDEMDRFLDDLHRAHDQGAHWTRRMGRVLPMERVFSITPETFEERLKEAVTPYLERMESGAFYVRLERRGFKGKILSPEVEQAVDTHLILEGEARGKSLRVAFKDPDYKIAVETVGSDCGIALIPRELTRKYPLVKIR